MAGGIFMTVLAQRGYFKEKEFVNYLSYLQYWKKQEYAKYLKWATASEIHSSNPYESLVVSSKL